MRERVLAALFEDEATRAADLPRLVATAFDLSARLAETTAPADAIDQIAAARDAGTEGYA